MSKLRSFQRHLNPSKVWLANQVAEEKIKIARQVVLDHAKKDAQFAADVLKAVGENLPKEIKEACEASVSESNKTVACTTISANLPEDPLAAQVVKAMEHVGGDLTDRMVPILTDGGGEILVNETDLPDYPRDGDEPPLDITEKLVQEKGTEAEKA